jgi:hypothetical protein
MEKIPWGQDKILLGKVTAHRTWSQFRYGMKSFCEAVMRAVDKMAEDIKNLRIRCEAEGISFQLPPSTQNQFAKQKSATFANPPVRLEKRFESYKSSGSPYRPHSQRLSAVDFDDDVSYYEDGFTDEAIPGEDAVSVPQGDLQQREELELEADDFDDAISHLSVANKEGGPQPCFKKMRMGHCPDGPNCKYSHDDVVIRQGILQAQAKLMSYPLFKNSGVRVTMPPDYRVPTSRTTPSTPQRSAGGYPQRRTPGAVNFVASEEQNEALGEADR